ncbi:MAG TPA: non-homologous end-joining DNA ligase [Micromonosporaceae bacterium]|jgi:bifunctional non-homologous end joining protein LigD
MLASTGELPAEPGWAYELKWDGVRALAVVQATPSPAGPVSSVRLYARTGAEITKAYPELAGLGTALADEGITEAVLDGEVVLLDREGRPDFIALAERIHVRDTVRARKLAASIPVHYMIFDILSANGSDLTRVSYEERRELLESILPPAGAATRWMVPPRFTDGQDTMAASQELGMEGVVAKRLTSLYRPGIRTTDWIKVKNEQTGDYVVGGWHSQRRAISGLLVGLPRPDGLIYRGRVGGGISAATERDLLTRLEPLRNPTSPFAADQVPREERVAVSWVRPELVVEVRYGQLTPDGRLRFPRFVRLRPDKQPHEAGDA